MTKASVLFFSISLFSFASGSTDSQQATLELKRETSCLEVQALLARRPFWVNCPSRSMKTRYFRIVFTGKTGFREEMRGLRKIPETASVSLVVVHRLPPR